MQLMRRCALHGSVCYGEAKCTQHTNNNFSTCQDLVRVATFSKNALDTSNMKGVLGIQVVGLIIDFYVLIMPFPGLYTLLKLTEIRVPSCLLELPHLIADVPSLL